MAEPQRQLTQAPAAQKLDLSQAGLAKPARTMQTIQALFADRSVTSRIAAVIPKHLTPERLLKVIVSSISKTPKLLECSQMSLLQSVIAMSELGLEPDAVRGLAYLVPYKGTCQLIIGYRGYIELARRSGNLRQIEARLVRENDKLDICFGLEPRFEHVPCLDGDAGPPKLVYAIARYADGGEHIEVMTVAEVEAIRKRSRAATLNPWVTDFEAMAKKTVVRQLAKWLPLSPELVKAIEIDDEQFVDAAKPSTPTAGRAMSASTPVLVADNLLGASIDALDMVPAEASTPPHDPVTGEVLEEEAPPSAIADTNDGPPDELAAEIAALTKAIGTAGSKTELRKLVARIQALPELEKSELLAAYETRAKALTGANGGEG